MTTARRVHYSHEDYLHALEMSEVKLEYGDGVIYAMAGGTPAHGALSVAVASVLKQALAGRCSVFSSDVKIRVDATDMFAFPAVSVVCGPLERAAMDKNTLTNPVLLVEVTSRSTEDFDRSDKLSQYKQLPSLRAVLFVSHRSKTITVVQRGSAGWDEKDYRAGEQVVVADPQLRFGVESIYEGIELDPV